MATTGFDRCAGPDGRTGLYSVGIDTIQINIGRHCNLQCQHCHVESGPAREEMMGEAVLDAVVQIARNGVYRLFDITGGAPELHPHIRPLVRALSTAHQHVQIRTNLTAMLEPESRGLPEFLRENEVALVASLPCYLEENVATQRGTGVYEQSIEALKALNALGYGRESHLPLTLVYNPGGPALPPPQGNLEAAYRAELRERHGVEFTSLAALTNVPVGRFRQSLLQEQKLRAYERELKEAFNPATVGDLMCRHQISIDYDGRLYDCDFNIALGKPVGFGAPRRVEAYDRERLSQRRIATGNHCFACTAGAGSSCGGALSASASAAD
jgi:radical SAM/Cys-rich protein